MNSRGEQLPVTRAQHSAGVCQPLPDARASCTARATRHLVLMPNLLTTKDLSALLRKGRTATYQTTRLADFPDPLKVGGDYRWLEDEVLVWLMNQRVTERPLRKTHDIVRNTQVTQETLFTERPSKRRAA